MKFNLSFFLLFFFVLISCKKEFSDIDPFSNGVAQVTITVPNSFTRNSVGNLRTTIGAVGAKTEIFFSRKEGQIRVFQGLDTVYSSTVSDEIHTFELEPGAYELEMTYYYPPEDLSQEISLRYEDSIVITNQGNIDLTCDWQLENIPFVFTFQDTLVDALGGNGFDIEVRHPSGATSAFDYPEDSTHYGFAGNLGLTEEVTFALSGNGKSFSIDYDLVEGVVNVIYFYLTLDGELTVSCSCGDEPIIIDTENDSIQVVFNTLPTGILLSDTTVLENQPYGAFVGILSTIDANADDVHTYSLVSGFGDNDNSQFYISADSLYITSTVDYDSIPSYTIRVQSTDSSGETVERRFNIGVENVGTWTRVTANPGWVGRRNHSSVVFDNKMWVIGGYNGSYLNDVWSSNDGVTWIQDTSLANWPARSNHTSVVFDNKIWVMAGLNGTNPLTNHFNDVWSSSDSSNWNRVDASANWISRYLSSSVIYNNKIWILGGSRGNSATPDLNDVWSSSDGSTWNQANDSSEWTIRGGHTSVIYNNKMWIIGGNEDGNDLNDVWSSSNGANWSSVNTSSEWAARRGHTSVIFDNKIWIIGGGNNTNALNDVWSSSDGSTWNQVGGAAEWGARRNHTSVVFDNTIWVLGGSIGNDPPNYNDVWRYDN